MHKIGFLNIEIFLIALSDTNVTPLWLDSEKKCRRDKIDGTKGFFLNEIVAKRRPKNLWSLISPQP